MITKLIIGGVIGAIFIAALVELWLKRGKSPRPLAERMKDGMPETSATKKPLGMEATDLKIVEDAQKLNERAALKSQHVKFK